MFDVSRDIHSLTDFKRNTASFLEQLRDARRALVLTVNGKSEIAVMGADTFQFVLQALEQLDAIQGIRQGLDQSRRGEGVSLDEFEQTMREKHGLQSRGDAMGTDVD